MNVVSHSAAQAQTQTPPPNAIVVEETKTVEVAPKKKAPATKGTTKKVTTGKNSFTTTTTTTTEVPAPAAPAGNNAYPQQSYTAPAVNQPASGAPAYTTPAASAPAPVATSVPTGTSTAATAPAAAPAPESRWNAVYFGEYFGPRFSNFDISRTSGPRDTTDTAYTVIDHSVKLWYKVAKNNKIGVQVRGRTPFDPDQTFFFKNLRLMGTWKNMIDTADVNMGSQLDIEFPTMARQREAGKLLDLNLKFNWEIKTSLRNWSFSATTMVRPSFYNDPTNKSDVYFGLFPWITMDFAPGWQLIFEGSFDASHQYQAIAFDLNTTEGADDPDFIRTGVGYNFNSNVSINPAIQWYTSDLSPASTVLYLSLSASI